MNAPANAVCFGPFKLDLKAGELRKDGRKVRLQEQPFQVLKTLLAHSAEVVTREEIRKKLWPNDTIVEFDHSINAAIKKLRLALGDSAEEPQYVETVARRGYRFIAPVDGIAAVGAGLAPPEVAQDAESAALPGTVPQCEPGSASFESAALLQRRAAELETNFALPRESDRSLIGKRVSHYRVLECWVAWHWGGAQGGGHQAGPHGGLEVPNGKRPRGPPGRPPWGHRARRVNGDKYVLN